MAFSRARHFEDVFVQIEERTASLYNLRNEHCMYFVDVTDKFIYTVDVVLFLTG